MAASKVKVGVGGRMFPPAEAMSEYFRRVEAQGWDFVQFADQLQGTHPIGMLGRPVSDRDPAVVNGVYGEEWFATIPTMATVAAVTEKIDIHVGSIDVVRRPPALWAQEVLTLWHLSGGRTRMHIAQGEKKQFTPYGISHAKPMTRMAEALEIIDALWDSGGQPISRESEFWPLKDAVFPLELYEGTKPKLLITGGGPKAEALAARYGGWSTFLPGGISDNPEILKETIDRIKRGAEEHGHDPESLEFNGMIIMAIGETDEEAWRQARLPALGWMSIVGASISAGEAWKQWGYENPLGDFAWPADVGVNAATKEEAEELAEKVPDEITDHSVVWGAPERITSRVQEYVEAGINQLCFWNYGSMADPSTSDAFVPLMDEVVRNIRGEGLDVDARSLAQPA